MNRRPIQRASPKRKRDLARYRMLKKLFLEENAVCFRCGCYTPYSEKWRHLHHYYGRVGALLCYEPGFRLSCAECHTWIETHRELAAEQGFRAPANLFGRPSKVIPKVQLDQGSETMRIGKVTYSTVG